MPKFNTIPTPTVPILEAPWVNPYLCNSLTILLMLTMNSKLLEFFIHIPKLEVDGSSWVIFKDHFTFAAATTSLGKHINSTGTEPSPLAFVTGVLIVLTAEQTAEQELYEEKKLMWLPG